MFFFVLILILLPLICFFLSLCYIWTFLVSNWWWSGLLGPLLQVLEKDLAIFGFFIALSRSTQSFLSSNDINMSNEQIEGIIRCGHTIFFSSLTYEVSFVSQFPSVIWNFTIPWNLIWLIELLVFRYLIGGSVLYYPQLSSISSYQFYVEVGSIRTKFFFFNPIILIVWFCSVGSLWRAGLASLLSK